MLNSNIEFTIWYKFTINDVEYEISKLEYNNLTNLMGKISISIAGKKFKLPRAIIVILWNNYREKNNIHAILY